MPRPTWRRLAWLFAFVTIGCADAGADDDATVVTISSPPEPGSTVVNREPSWTRSTAWTLGKSPVVQIGGKRGSAPEDLLKVVGVARTVDGTLIIGNASTSELRYFDRKASFLTSAGGRGTVPGTFESLGWVQAL